MSGNQPILNDKLCPLLLALDTLFIIPSTSIISTVSIVHECSTTCHIESSKYHEKIEREDVELPGLSFIHDLTNAFILLKHLLHVI